MRSIPNQAKIRPAFANTCGSVTCARNLKSNVRYINLVGQISELLAEHSTLALRGCLVGTAGSEIRPYLPERLTL
jgi:hypothetical protein